MNVSQKSRYERSSYSSHRKGARSFFRVSTKEQADRLSLAGWVKNESDGSVLIEVEGPEAKVDKLITWCKQGPPASNVEKVEVEAISPKSHNSFSIKYW